MGEQIVSLEEERLKKILAHVYCVQTKNCLPDNIMPEVMKDLSLSEEGAIEIIRAFMRLGWIKTGNIKERYFLRPGYVSFFPIIISSRGLEIIK